MDVIKISNEDEAFKLFASIIDGAQLPDGVKVSFEGWPKISIVLKGDKFHGTLTPGIMKSLLELQNNLYRSYASVKYGSPSARLLSKEERDDLEIAVEVENGSSLLDINLGEWANKALELVGNKMTGTELVVTVLGLALVFTAKSAYSSYLDNRRQEREKELNSEDKRAVIEQLKFSSEQETERAKVMADAFAKFAELGNVNELAKDTKAGLLKGIAKADTGQLQGMTLEGEQAKILSQNARQKSLELRLDGTYRILNVDSSDPTSFKVRVQEIGTEVIFVAVVQDDTLERKYLTAMQQGEWDRKNVQMVINAKERHGQISSAVVLSARLAD